ncbi:putative Acetate/propionate kinase [Vibrio chagasii]|nr:putative Acetate/propionate kinase [Vibrio chagasii]
MKYLKKTLLAITIGSSIALTGCQSTGSSLDSQQVDMSRKLVKMERGVVLTYDNVEVKLNELNQGKDVGKGLILAGAGTAAVGGYNSSNTTAAVGGAVALAGLVTMIASNAEANKLYPAVRYTIELNNGSLDEIIQASEEEQIFAPNTPVLVRRYDNGQSFVRLDVTQGQTYTRAKGTTFDGDKEKEEAKQKELIAAEAERKEREDYLWGQTQRRIEAETSQQETHSGRTNDKIDAQIRATDNISEGFKNIAIEK